MNVKYLIREEINGFFQEALRDEIPDYMQNIIKKRHGDEYLDMDVPEHTNAIPNVKIEITDDNVTELTIDKIVKHFKENIFNEFGETKIYYLLNRSRSFNDFFGNSLENFNGINLTNINHLRILYSKEFRLPKLSNQGGDLKFSDNKSNIYTLYKYFLRYLKIKKHSTSFLPTYEEVIKDKKFSGLREPILNYNKNVEDLKKSKFYLYISDKPEDKLRMSVSKFYSSCQNIYTGGDQGTQWNKKLLSNVFDINSKMAYLIFASPFKDNTGNTHPYTPIARTIIRHMDDKIMFDKVYPMDMKNIMYKLIEDNTELKNQGEEKDFYKFKKVKGLPTPYMDTYRLKNIGDVSDEDGRMGALISYFNVEPKDINQVSEMVFEIDGEEWLVLSEEEANERARDNIMGSFEDHFYDTEIKRIIDYNIINEDDILSVLGMDGDELKEQGWDEVVDYLEEIGIKTFGDFIKNLIGNNIMDYRGIYSWYQDVVNYDSVVQYWGGEYEFRTSMLSYYDGDERESEGYLIYRES